MNNPTVVRTRKSGIRIVVGIFSLIAVAMGILLFWAVWLLPRGDGEYSDSPNALWRAHVSALSRGTLSLTRQHYIELKIERLVDGTTVWRQEVAYQTSDAVPDYGDRSNKFITWAADSSQFNVPITNGTIMTIPIPDPQ